MESFFLKSLFYEFENNNIRYLILRGYENLPETIEHDLDFYVTKSDLRAFYSVIHKLSKQYQYSVTRDVVRQGLIKIKLNFIDKIIKIDLFFEFRYAGLEYIDKDKLFESKVSNNGITIANNYYEFYTSFLKELLHNSRLRKDKIQKIQVLCDQLSPEYRNFDNFFPPEIINHFIEMIDNSVLFDNKLAQRARLGLLKKNVSKYNLLSVVYNIITFFYIKYFYQWIYDDKIFYRNLHLVI